MSGELLITAKGQVTLRNSVLRHLGVKPGAKLVLDLLADGRVELRAGATALPLSQLRGALSRPGQRTVMLEEMQEAIERGHDE